jgi:hypothetical protein
MHTVRAAARISKCGTSAKELGMQRRKLITLVVLCVVLVAIAMLVGGLPWDGLSSRAH